MRWITLFVLLALAACESGTRSAQQRGPEGITLVVARLGADSARLELRNASSDEVGYNLCPSMLEIRSGEAWQPVITDEVCTMELRVLQPDEEATYDKALPDELEPGEYRYVTSVEAPLGSAPDGVQSETFRVR